MMDPLDLAWGKLERFVSGPRPMLPSLPTWGADSDDAMLSDIGSVVTDSSHKLGDDVLGTPVDRLFDVTFKMDLEFESKACDGLAPLPLLPQISGSMTVRMSQTQYSQFQQGLQAPPLVGSTPIPNYDAFPPLQFEDDMNENKSQLSSSYDDNSASDGSYSNCKRTLAKSKAERRAHQKMGPLARESTPRRLASARPAKKTQRPAAIKWSCGCVNGFCGSMCAKRVLPLRVELWACNSDNTLMEKLNDSLPCCFEKKKTGRLLCILLDELLQKNADRAHLALVLSTSDGRRLPFRHVDVKNQPLPKGVGPSCVVHMKKEKNRRQRTYLQLCDADVDYLLSPTTPTIPLVPDALCPVDKTVVPFQVNWFYSGSRLQRSS